uniref:Uncharacterized protein n=1 Tax=Oryza punctata TaxID=4537 RepID=A0A0E0LGK6_ORYPU
MVTSLRRHQHRRAPCVLAERRRGGHDDLHFLRPKTNLKYTAAIDGRDVDMFSNHNTDLLVQIKALMNMDMLLPGAVIRQVECSSGTIPVSCRTNQHNLEGLPLTLLVITVWNPTENRRCPVPSPGVDGEGDPDELGTGNWIPHQQVVSFNVIEQ